MGGDGTDKLPLPLLELPAGTKQTARSIRVCSRSGCRLRGHQELCAALSHRPAGRGWGAGGPREQPALLQAGHGAGHSLGRGRVPAPCGQLRAAMASALQQ